MADTPARIWIDLDQMSQGYTDKAHEATPHDTAFVRAKAFDDLLVAVSHMRSAQKAYFRDRSCDALIKSKEAESKVDRLLKNPFETIAS
jgi:hypothetical protein